MASKQHPSLKPINPIIYVSSKGVENLSPDLLSSSIIGEKALGLSSLPKKWTLPFIVISNQLIEKYRGCDGEDKTELMRIWGKSIINAAVSFGLKDNDPIIVRSSSCSEGLKERGKYFSEQGLLKDVYTHLMKCMDNIISDIELKSACMPLVVQKYADPISLKGHLSNERRCSKETRDWMGEIEPITTQVSSTFKIPLRNWRKKINVAKKIDSPLSCNLSPHISEILKAPAAWATVQKLRIHFEWVWDGREIYIVQADQENKFHGVDPTKVVSEIDYPLNFKPQCLMGITKEHAQRFNKIRNVFTYMKLGMPRINLYVLDDQKIIKGLAEGQVPNSLRHDIEELVKYSLVIRMDITSTNQSKRQLLPRTNEVRKLNDALKWLKEQCKLMNQLEGEVAFIFHNFIPAESSAFAYAEPNKRKVQIEALWGLPEGLYYNSHDKYVVDTLKSNLTETPDDIQKYVIHTRPNYKRYFITPDKKGQWITQPIKPPHDWSESIGKIEWVRKIALVSRRIAEEEGQPLSIMWFIGIPEGVCDSPIIPWYHELFDSRFSSREKAHRKKTPFDKSLDISTSADIDKLKSETEKPKSHVRRIRIQPKEDKLLRDKETLKVIGELAKKIDAVILLEGGVLSHAYYQLQQTGATVEILHPFEDVEEKQEFNKLVRDKVPSNIEHSGELVSTSKLEGEYLLRALREKLIEEAVEVLDASDQDSIIGELADVKEVIDGIVDLLGIELSEISKRQTEKREKVGGFDTGTILLETKNPLPTVKEADAMVALFPDAGRADNKKTQPLIDGREIIARSHKLTKWSDKREHETSTEMILRVRIPVVRDNWSANTPKVEIGLGSGNNIVASLTGKRIGSKYEIELSIFTEYKQLELF